ncbi:hypothetical protein BEK67_18765 [Ralstonia pickettii]|nr:hypothetical protein BEK67_18765 [Ralstonia pickettii]
MAGDGGSGVAGAGAGLGGGGAGWMIVRGGSHGGIGDEQDARPIANKHAATAVVMRAWPASLTRQTARFMRFLPEFW